MLSCINSVLTVAEIEEKISTINNVLSCSVTGFNTKRPSVRIFFAPELERSERYNILKKVKEIMFEYGLADADNTDVGWGKVGFEVFYRR